MILFFCKFISYIKICHNIINKTMKFATIYFLLFSILPIIALLMGLLFSLVFPVFIILINAVNSILKSISKEIDFLN